MAVDSQRGAIDSRGPDGVIFLTAFVLLFAILVIAVIVSAINNPLIELVAATDRISKGDFNHKVEIKRGEIGHLALTLTPWSSLCATRAMRSSNTTARLERLSTDAPTEEAECADSDGKMSAIGRLAAKGSP